MLDGTASVGGLARAAGAKLLAAAAMLAATAAVMVAVGGSGVLGPLGDLIAGAASADERARVGDGGTRARPDDAIVAAAPAATARRAGVRPAPRSTTSRAPRTSPRGDDRGPVARAPRPARPRPTTAPAPRPSGSSSPPQSTPGQPEQPRTIDRVGQAVDEVAKQAPAPAKPVTDAVGTLADDVAKTCREQLPVCP